MGRIELFDSYISNQLSEEQRKEFETRLKSDENFAADFKIYLLSVDGICREAQQDNMDFGLAMKRLSKEKLREIVGKGSISQPEKVPYRVKRFKPWMWQAASIAAVVVIAFTVVFNIERNARYSLYDSIYNNAEFEDTPTRGSQNNIDITKLTDTELNEALPKLVENYEESQDLEEKYTNGYKLSMAYIRLHKPDEALNVLQDLVTALQDDIDYEYEVRDIRFIISLLKQD